MVGHKVQGFGQAGPGRLLTRRIAFGSAKVDTSAEQRVPDPLVDIGEKVRLRGVVHASNVADSEPRELYDCDITAGALPKKLSWRCPRETPKVANEMRLVVVAGIDSGRGPRGSGLHARERALQTPQRDETLGCHPDARQETPLELAHTDAECTGGLRNAAPFGGIVEQYERTRHHRVGNVG